MLGMISACGAPSDSSGPLYRAPIEQGDSGADFYLDEAAADDSVEETVADNQLVPDYAVTASASSDGSDGERLSTSTNKLAPARRIIKDAQMSIRVENVDLGISRLSGIAAQSGGYVLETGSDRQNQYYRTAVVKMAVDVGQEYVDLQGQIANLEATEARIRGFLDQAKSVEEALQVNARLTEIEGEISHRRARCIAFAFARCAEPRQPEHLAWNLRPAFALAGRPRGLGLKALAEEARRLRPRMMSRIRISLTC
jgi:hypothetical protein